MGADPPRNTGTVLRTLRRAAGLLQYKLVALSRVLKQRNCHKTGSLSEKKALSRFLLSSYKAQRGDEVDYKETKISNDLVFVCCLQGQAYISKCLMHNIVCFAILTPYFI